MKKNSQKKATLLQKKPKIGDLFYNNAGQIFKITRCINDDEVMYTYLNFNIDGRWYWKKYPCIEVSGLMKELL